MKTTSLVFPSYIFLYQSFIYRFGFCFYFLVKNFKISLSHDKKDSFCLSFVHVNFSFNLKYLEWTLNILLTSISHLLTWWLLTLKTKSSFLYLSRKEYKDFVVYLLWIPNLLISRLFFVCWNVSSFCVFSLLFFLVDDSETQRLLCPILYIYRRGI